MASCLKVKQTKEKKLSVPAKLKAPVRQHLKESS
jgi:hypothetical protein